MVWASSRSLDAFVLKRVLPWITRLSQNDIHVTNNRNDGDVLAQTCFSACSAGQPCTCLIRFSLKWAARVGVKEQEGRAAAEAVGGAEEELGALLLLEETWLGPGEGLLWLLQSTQVKDISIEALYLWRSCWPFTNKTNQLVLSIMLRTQLPFFQRWDLEFQAVALFKCLHRMFSHSTVVRSNGLTALTAHYKPITLTLLSTSVKILIIPNHIGSN